MILQPHAAWRLGLAFAMAMVAASAVAAQQPATAPAPSVLQGFQGNRDKPIQINATTLEVRDKDKKATFIGNVVVVQGDTTLKCKLLDVFYDQDTPDADPKKGQAAAPPPPAPAAAPFGASGQQIRRLEAKGGVTVIQKEQTATGETAIYDLKTNSITLNGNVTVTQGTNVIRGNRIVVDLTTNVMSVLSSNPNEAGVQALINPNSKPETMKNTKADPAKSEAAKSDLVKSGKRERNAPKQGNAPMKLN
jgi:lipopolysaccharide export system protein LptA